MSLYGLPQLVDSMRAVRTNTILMAEDVPEAQYGFRATPATRSIAETLVHIAWLSTADRVLHVDKRLRSFDGFDFPALLATSAREEQTRRSRDEIVELLRTDSERHTAWLAQQSPDFLAERIAMPGGGSVSRFEMLLGTKEHELQHRAQLTVLQRMIGIAPRFTGLS